MPKTTPRLQTLIWLVYLPSLAFALVVWIATPLFVLGLDAEAELIAKQVGAQEAAGVRQLTEHAENPWIWASLVATAFAFIGFVAARWVHRVAQRRMRHIGQFLEDLAEGRDADVLHVEAEDELGKIERGLTILATSLHKRDRALRMEADSHELEAQVQRGLAVAETEAQVLDLAQRTFDQVSPEVPTELLMSDSSGTRLLSVLQSGGEPACPVSVSRECIAARRGHTMQFPDAEALDACPKLRGREDKVGSALCVPVTVLGQPIGVLHAIAPVDTPINEETHDAYQSLARHLGARLAMIRALETSQMRAETDSLTGLLNRRSFADRSAAAFESGDVAVALADLDHFKNLNDTYGHDAGDRALKRFAQVLRQTLRPTDLVARYGGEEFVMILVDSDAETARQALDRLREALAKANERAAGPSFTASFGVALRPEHGLDLDELVRAADQALYKAKENGRNRIEVAGRAAIQAVSSEAA